MDLFRIDVEMGKAEVNRRNASHYTLFTLYFFLLGNLNVLDVDNLFSFSVKRIDA